MLHSYIVCCTSCLPTGLMLRDAEPNEIGQAKSDTPGTVLTPCEAGQRRALARGWCMACEVVATALQAALA